MYILEVKSLIASYGKMEILHDLSFAIKEGSITVIVGSNGAGKTTTLKAIAGLLKVISGSVIFKGKDIHDLPPHRIVEKGISLIPEDGKIFPYMTVQQNLRLGAFKASAWQKQKLNMEEVYELFPRLRERSKQIARTLSGGERQMLVIGRGLMSEPELLLIDEPSLGLAPNLVTETFRIIKDINEVKRISILLVEQNVAQALKICDGTYVIENGMIIMKGRGEELVNNPQIKEAYLRV